MLRMRACSSHQHACVQLRKCMLPPQAVGLLSLQVFFLTGADEHGQKIADTAASMGLKPIELCDKSVAAFQACPKPLLAVATLSVHLSCAITALLSRRFLASNDPPFRSRCSLMT